MSADVDQLQRKGSLLRLGMFFIERTLNQRRVSKMLVGFKKTLQNKVCIPIRVAGPGVLLFSQVNVRLMFPNVLLNL